MGALAGRRRWRAWECRSESGPGETRTPIASTSVPSGGSPVSPHSRGVDPPAVESPSAPSAQPSRSADAGAAAAPWLPSTVPSSAHTTS
eukprot:4416761-Prymnesium_polylepis.1